MRVVTQNENHFFFFNSKKKKIKDDVNINIIKEIIFCLLAGTVGRVIMSVVDGSEAVLNLVAVDVVDHVTVFVLLVVSDVTGIRPSLAFVS